MQKARPGVAAFSLLLDSKLTTFHSSDTQEVTSNSSLTNSSDFNRIVVNEEAARLTYDFIGYSLLVIFLLGSTFNMMAIWLFIKCPNLRSSTNTYITALCVCNFCWSCLGSPLSIYLAFTRGRLEPSALCSGFGFFCSFAALTTFQLMCAVSVGRYINVVRPSKLHGMKWKFVFVTISCCVGQGLFWATVPLLGWNTYEPEGLGLTCGPTWNTSSGLHFSYNLAIFFFCFMIPLLICCFCYLRIVHSIRTSASSSYCVRHKDGSKELQRSIAAIVCLIVGIFIACWTPYLFIVFLPDLGLEPSDSVLVETFPFLIIRSSCIWNPLIYVGFNKRYRLALASMKRSSCLAKEAGPDKPCECNSSEIKTVNFETANLETVNMSVP